MLTKKTLVMLSTLTLVTTCVAFSTPTTEAAAKRCLLKKKLRLKQKQRPTLRKGSHSSYVKRFTAKLKGCEV